MINDSLLSYVSTTVFTVHNHTYKNCVLELKAFACKIEKELNCTHSSPKMTHINQVKNV